MKNTIKVILLIISVVLFICALSACSQIGPSEETGSSAETAYESTTQAPQADPQQKQERLEKLLAQKFTFDEQKEFTPNVLLVDYYETKTRTMVYYALKDIYYDTACRIYSIMPEEALTAEALPEGRTPRCKIVRYTLQEGMTPYDQAALFVENSQVRMIMPEYTGEDSVDALIASRPQTEAEQYSFSESAGLEISDVCWDWITDRCTCVPPGDIESWEDYRLLIHCYELLDAGKYEKDQHIRSIEITSHSNWSRETDGCQVYRVELEDNVNFYEGASLFFGEYNNIFYIDAEQYPPEEQQDATDESVAETEEP